MSDIFSRRLLLGILAILFIGGGIAMCLLATEGGFGLTTGSACVRIGAVLGALWLALPQITSFFTNTPRWMFIAGGAVLVVGALNWQLLIVAIPAAGALWMFGPRLLGKSKLLGQTKISSILTSPGRRARRKRE